MNERIKQLEKQAYTEVGHERGMSRYMEFDKEKFAELIVKECAKLVEDNMDPQNAWITPAYIKEHFGVEE